MVKFWNFLHEKSNAIDKDIEIRNKNRILKMRKKILRDLTFNFYNCFIFSVLFFTFKKSHRCTRRDKRFESYSTVVPFSMWHQTKKKTNWRGKKTFVWWNGRNHKRWSISHKWRREREKKNNLPTRLCDICRSIPGHRSCHYIKTVAMWKWKAFHFTLFKFATTQNGKKRDTHQKFCRCIWYLGHEKHHPRKKECFRMCARAGDA